MTLILPDAGERDPWEWMQYDPTVAAILDARTLGELVTLEHELNQAALRWCSKAGETRRGRPVRVWCETTKTFLHAHLPEFITCGRRAIAQRRTELEADGLQARGAHSPHQHESKQHV